jgi:hypothetical protein
MAIHPGTLAVFSASIAARHPQRITLEKVSLLPLPGFRLPRLSHAALLADSGDPAGTARTWPPEQLGGKGQVRVKSLTGAVVWPGIQHGKAPPRMVYEVTAPGLGGYATAGIRLVYKVGGQTETAFIHNAAIFLWYFPQHLPPAADRADGKRYQAADARANKALTALTAVDS